MKSWMTVAAGLVLILMLACEREAMAQSIPPVVTPVAPPQRTIWGFFGLSAANLSSCRTKLASTEFGSLLGNTLKPMSQFTGGLIGGSGLGLQPIPGVGGVAAGGPAGALVASNQVKQYQASAKATIDAIEHLATLDCHYWPEAEKALIEGLRANRIECVRLAAARALERGCCCSKRTIEALRIVVDGSEEDGNPSETSPRVRATSFRALQRCLRTSPEPEADPEPATPLEAPVPAKPKATAAPTRASGNFYDSDRFNEKSDRQVIATAWQSLSAKSRGGAAAHVSPSTLPRELPPGRRESFERQKPAISRGAAVDRSIAVPSPKDILIILPGSSQP